MSGVTPTETVAQAVVDVRTARAAQDAARLAAGSPSNDPTGIYEEVYSHVVTAGEDTANLVDFLTPFTKVHSYTVQVLAVTTFEEKNALRTTLRSDGRTVRVADGGTTTLAAGDTITLRVRGVGNSASK